METGRRKSCDACVRSKRRCELGRPQCRRCLIKNIECVYPNSTSSEANSGYVASQDVASTGLTASSSDEVQHRGDFSTVPATPSPSMNGAWFEFHNEPFNLPTLPDDTIFDVSFVGSAASQQCTDIVQRVDRSSDVYVRSEFVSKRLAQVPKSFVEQGQTSFIHRSLLQSTHQAVLQDAMSAAALYFFRNDNNSLVVFRTLEQKARSVIETMDLQVTNRISLLAATQALLIYQLIRLFDGDIRLRAQAEAAEVVLISWADRLRSSKSSLISISYADIDWQSWLFEESIRRTVIVAFMLKGIYAYLKTGQDTEQSLRLRFNARGSLWNAQSARGWAAIRDKQADLDVQVSHWNSDIGKASPDDLEDLGVQIMTMLWGVDTTAQWLSKDSLLGRYGFEGA